MDVLRNEAGVEEFGQFEGDGEDTEHDSGEEDVNESTPAEEREVSFASPHP